MNHNLLLLGSPEKAAKLCDTLGENAAVPAACFCIHNRSAAVQDGDLLCVFSGTVYSYADAALPQGIFKGLGIPLYFIFVLVSTYVVNGTRGFWPGFWQMFAILFIMNLIDRFFIDEYWVGHTKAWEIPGTEDLKPYINRKDKLDKWLMGTVGFAILSAVLAGIMAMAMR